MTVSVNNHQACLNDSDDENIHYLTNSKSKLPAFDIDKPHPIPSELLPDKQANSTKPAKTIRNAEEMLNAYGITVQYDIISKDIRITIRGFESFPDISKNNAMTYLVSLANLNGIFSGNFEKYIYAIAGKNAINPVLDYITQKPWDGLDRLKAMYKTITAKEGFHEILKKTLMRKWFLSAIAAVTLKHGFSCRGVLTLNGDQSIGKTRWISRLISDEGLSEELIKLDHLLDANNKDSIISATKHWIVEIGELDSSFKKDIGRIKGFITNTKDKVRLPYDRRESEYLRRTIFAATVNNSNFLVDDTGNTRWWTIPCESINHQHDIDMQQFWAQIYHMFTTEEEHKQYWLNPKEQDWLESYNNDHKVVTAVADKLNTELDFESSELNWSKKSATEVLVMVGIDKPTNAQAKECGSYLRVRIGSPKKSNGSMKWLVPPTRKK